MVLLSVIIPTYNVEEYIEKTIYSVLNQSSEEVEILVIDDCSTDKTRDIVRSIFEIFNDNKYRILISDKNNGVSYCRNIGIKNAIGKYLYFLDGDDYVEEDFFHYLKNIIITSEPDVIAFGVNTVRKNKSVLNEYFLKYDYNEISSQQTGIETLDKIMKNKMLINTCSAVYKKDLVVNSNVTFTEYCSNGEDIEFIYKMLINSFDVRFIHKVLSNNVRRPGSITTSNNIRKFEVVYALIRTADYIKLIDNQNAGHIAGRINAHKIVRNFLQNYCLNITMIEGKKLKDKISALKDIENKLKLHYPAIKRLVIKRFIKSSEINIGRKLINVLYVHFPIVYCYVYRNKYFNKTAVF